MVNKGKLKMALAAEKGVDFQKLHQKKVAKLARQKKDTGKVHGGAKQTAEDDEDAWEDDVDGGAPVVDDEEDDEEDEDSEDEEEELDLAAIDDSSDSESEVEMEAKIERKPKPKTILKPLNAKTSKPNGEDEEEKDDEEDPEEAIALSDLDDLPDDEKEDLIPHSRLTINNTTALLAALHRIAIPTDKSVAFATHQCLMSAESTADGIEDIQDDLKRELSFYAQSLDAAKRARVLLKNEGVPFTRPNDFFAEMVKDDGHMEKVKARLVEQASSKKASAEARKLRDMKKFGKQVQVSKMQERSKAKKETLEKIKSLKRKRQESSGDVGEKEADLFDVGVDHEIQKHNSDRAFGRGGREGDSGAKRQKKNEKYGFGGKKRYSKSGDAMSSADMSGFSAKRMKTGTKGKPMKTARLGKNKRVAKAGKR